jgi:hypothetical protein
VQDQVLGIAEVAPTGGPIFASLVGPSVTTLRAFSPTDTTGGSALGEPVVVIGTDGTNAFYTSMSAPTKVKCVAVDGTIANEIITVAGTDGVAQIVAVGSDVFLKTVNPGPVAQVETAHTSGGQATVVTSVPFDSSLAANGSFMFWTDHTQVHRANHDGTAQSVIATVAASSLAADESAVYLTTAVGEIIRVQLDTLALTTLAKEQENPSGITVHGDRVYWINNRAGVTAPVDGNAVLTTCSGTH